MTVSPMTTKTLRASRPAWLALTASLVLAGCVNLAPPVPERDSTMLPDTLGESLAQPQQSGQAAPGPALDWLQSQRLEQVVQQALLHNRDLRVAVANLQKAQAQYGVQKADRWPTLAAAAQGSRSQQADDLSATGQGQISSQYTAQLAVTSYELDLWGRVRNLNDAALQQFLQVGVNQRAVQLALVADVATAWLNLGANQARLALAQQTLVSREQAFLLTQRMHELGATNGLVLAQNQTTVDAARGDVAAYLAQVQRDRNALELLVGSGVAQDKLPLAEDWGTRAIASLAPVGSDWPSSLLLLRPDVLAAEHNLRAMTAHIGAARAAMFPSISLTASAGTASNQLSGLFDSGNGTWSFVPQIRLPIFDAGRNRANVAVAQANQTIALAQYEKSIQVAFREVRDVLADRSTWAERLKAQASLVGSTQKALDLSEARFKSGVDNYLTVLDAQRSLYGAQQTQISLQLAEQINRVTLYKVVGGSEAVVPGAAATASP